MYLFLKKHFYLLLQSENLRFGEPKASNISVRKSAEKAGLIDDINNFPQKFKTIGERGITLSGGQRQRTALGRALVNSPIIVLGDASKCR